MPRTLGPNWSMQTDGPLNQSFLSSPLRQLVYARANISESKLRYLYPALGTTSAGHGSHSGAPSCSHRDRHNRPGHSYGFMYMKRQGRQAGITGALVLRVHAVRTVGIEGLGPSCYCLVVLLEASAAVPDVDMRVLWRMGSSWIHVPWPGHAGLEPVPTCATYSTTDGTVAPYVRHLCSHQHERSNDSWILNETANRRYV